MRKIMLAACLALVPGSTPGPAAEEQGDARWIENDWARAQQQARRLGKPIFVVLRCPH